MVDYYFRPQPAITRDGELITQEGSGQVFAITDTTFSTPLTVTLDGGVTSTNVGVSAIGQTGGFTVAGNAEVNFKSGNLVSPLVAWSSIVSNMADALASVLAASSAASAASAASVTAIEQMRAQFLTFLSNNPNPNGIVVLAPLDPEPDPSLFTRNTLVVRLTPSEV